MRASEQGQPHVNVAMKIQRDGRGQVLHLFIDPSQAQIQALVLAPVRTAHLRRLIFPRLRCRLLSMKHLRKIPALS